MRVDCSIFVRCNTRVHSRVNDDGSFVVLFEGHDGAGDDVRVHFASLSEAERLADAIFRAKMDRDADEMQTAQEVAK